MVLGILLFDCNLCCSLSFMGDDVCGNDEVEDNGIEEGGVVSKVCPPTFSTLRTNRKQVNY